MNISKSRKIWEEFGSRDPYFGVATLDRFRYESLDDNSRAEFFRSGEEYVEEIFEDVQRHIDSSFSPSTVLDFGCGVGRILIPLAKRCESTLGLDISQNMLDCARENCEESSITNTKLALSDDDLSNLVGKYDLIHSYIVFQHISPSLGLKHVEKFVEHLSENGVGVMHFTYANENSRLSRLRFALYRDVPFVYRIRSFILKKGTEPLMPMYEYDLNAILHLIQKKGCTDCFIKFTDHGLRGALIYFQKKTVKGSK